MNSAIETLKKLEVASFQAARLAANAGDGESYLALVLFTSLTRSARESAEIRAYEAGLEKPVSQATA